MKITNEHVGRLLEARLERIHRASQPPRLLGGERGQVDQASFSPLAEDMRIALAAARSSAEVEDPRLASLAARVRQGEYHVPAEEIADALLRDLRGI
jgi:hypothetical protein